MVHNEIMAIVIGKHTEFHDVINHCRNIYLVASIHTLHIYTTMQSCKHTHISLVTYPREVVQHSIHNPLSVNYTPWWNNTYFMVLRGRMNTPGAYRLKIAHSRESLAFPHLVCRQLKVIGLRKKYTGVVVANSSLLFSMQNSLSPSFWLEMIEKGAEQTQCCRILVVTYDVMYYFMRHPEEHSLWSLLTFP